MQTEELAAYTWDDVVKAERGKVFVDRYDDGIKFRILRGGSSLCAYVGVPDSHPMAGFSYDDVPLDCHGGLTFGGKGDGKYHPAGWYWYGWDYSHCGDRSTYDETYSRSLGRDEKRWTPADVDKDSWSALYEFKKLVWLAEKIANRRQP